MCGGCGCGGRALPIRPDDEKQGKTEKPNQIRSVQCIECSRYNKGNSHGQDSVCSVKKENQRNARRA